MKTNVRIGRTTNIFKKQKKIRTETKLHYIKKHYALLKKYITIRVCAPNL